MSYLLLFQRKQWIHERASILRHTYIAGLVFIQNKRNQNCAVCAECSVLTWRNTVNACVLFTNIRL